MKNSKKLYGIIGLGRFGFSLADSLAKSGQEILVMDCNENRIREAAAFTDNALVVRELSKDSLTESGVQNCDVVFVCIGEKIDTSILTTLNVLELGVKKVISKATSPEHGTVLERLGAEVVYPERDMALRLSKRYTSGHILEYISLNSEFNITELRLSKRIHNKTLKELELRQKYGLNVIAILLESGIVVTDILPETRLNKEDTIVVCGKEAGILEFEREISIV